MINKFQQGGSAQQGSVLQQIQQLPEEQQKQIMQAFAKWAQQKGVDLKQIQNNPQALEAALGQFVQELQQASQGQQTVAARHGAKLNYLKSLKNQCPEGQEPYYYKKGGMLKCGCTGKKFEDGGEVKKENAITKFKKTIINKKSNLKEGIKKGAKTIADSTVKTAKAKQWSNEYKRTMKASGIYDSPTKDYVAGDKCGGKVKKHQKGTTKGGMTYTKEKSPYFLEETFATQPDEFGRHLRIIRNIYPRDDSFKNDTIYRGNIYKDNELVNSTGNYTDNGKIQMIKGSPGNYMDNGKIYIDDSQTYYTTPGSILGLNQYKNWGDYFEHLLRVRKFFNPFSSYIDNK